MVTTLRMDEMYPRAGRSGKRGRRLALGIASVGVALAAGWGAVHRYPAVGSAVADGLRSVIGAERVARVEDAVYGVEDWFHRTTRADEAPKAYWAVPDEAFLPVVEEEEDMHRRPAFRPADVGPVHASMKAEGDGAWVSVPDPRGGPALMHKTLLHPDPRRPWAELFVVALDLPRLDLEWVPGTVEPRTTTLEGRGLDRPGLIPADRQAQLVAGFNGGFKLQHGRWGAGVAEAAIATPNPYGCTVGRSSSGALSIGPWSAHDEEVRDDLRWWRQTPPCMVLDGKRHGALWNPEVKGWGATLEGGTVIRRSAIGLDASRTTLFVAVSNHTTAPALADGMRHAGAVDVAQLDVNWSYPRFVVFPEEAAERRTRSLFDGFRVGPDDYLRTPQTRDFFYLTRRADDSG